MIAEILANVLGGILTEALSSALNQPMKRIFDERNMRQALIKAAEHAEERFAQEYRAIDAELTDALTGQTRFVNTPTVQGALEEMLTQPFRDPTRSIATIRRSFHDVLPARIDRKRVDDAVASFLHHRGQEVLYIPQLQPLYALAFQKMSAESNRNTASNTAAIVESLQILREDIRQLPQAFPFPALTTIEQLPEPLTPRHNLPQRTYTHFVGREAELQKLTQLLMPYPRSRHFLMTLDGIGEVGKSALALEIAYRYRDGYNTLPNAERFEAIIWISAKRTLLTASGVHQRRQTFSTLGDLYREIATVLELPSIMQVDEEQRRGLVEHALTTQRTLLIVDNLETVDDEEVLTFLRELPDPTKALVTTRHRIDIAYAIRLAGMPRADAQVLMELEAERKGVTLPTDTIEDLYRRTGGIPLAIVWSIALMSLGYGIDSVLRRLGSGHSDIARFCFEESVAHIRDRDAYRVLLALALFEASVNRKMLGEVAGLGNDEVGRDDALAELLQLSLVNQERDRFTLLPLTRSFVLDALEHHAGLERELREQWIAHLTAFAQLYAGPDWYWRDIPQLYQEGSHLGTLASWAQETMRLDILLQIIPALITYYDRTGQWSDLLNIAQVSAQYAHLIGNLESITYIEIALAWVWSQQGFHEGAEHAILKALDAAQQTNDIVWQCIALHTYSQVLRRQNAYDRATECCQKVLQLLTLLSETQKIYMQADMEYELGKIARDCNDWHKAQIHFLTARNVFRYEDDNSSFNPERAWGLVGNLGLVAHKLGDLETAAQMYAQTLKFFKDSGGIGFMTTTLVRLASLEEERGNQILAMKYAIEALDWSKRLRMVREQAQAEAIFHRLSKKDSQ